MAIDFQAPAGEKWVPAGNYPGPIWSLVVDRIRNRMAAGLNVGWTRKQGYLIVMDIHHFSEFCEANDHLVCDFIQDYFLRFSKHLNFLLQSENIHGNIYKFVGDAIIFLIEPESRDNLGRIIEVCKGAFPIWQQEFRQRYPLNDTNIAMVISKVECWEGLVKGDRYWDFSIWGKGINYAFKVFKQYSTEGKLALTREVINDLPPGHGLQLSNLEGTSEVCAVEN